MFPVLNNYVVSRDFRFPKPLVLSGTWGKVIKKSFAKYEEYGMYTYNLKVSFNELR